MELIERVVEVMEGEEIDDVIPMLTYLLATIGRETCSDHRVLLSFIEGVVKDIYEIPREHLND